MSHGNSWDPFVNTLVLESDLFEEREQPYERYQNKTCPIVEVKYKNIPIEAMVDSGASVSAIDSKYFEELQRSVGEIPTLPLSRMTILTATRNKSSPITKQVMLEIEIQQEYFCVICLIVRNLLYKIILGYPFLCEQGAVMDLHQQTLSLKNIVTPIVTEEAGTLEIPCNALKIEELREKMDEKMQECSRLTASERGRLYDVLNAYGEIFCPKSTPVKDHQVKIELLDEKPYKCKLYPVAVAYQEKVSQELNQMVQDGIIRVCNTAYINPIVIVVKADSSIRICLDARKLNSLIVPRREAPHKIEDILMKFNGTRYFTVLDLKAAFWQLSLERNSQKYTGFSFKGRTYVFCRVPFGLQISSSALIAYLNELLEEFQDNVAVYVDDLTVHTETFEEHIIILERLFRKLRENNVTLNIEKSKFCVDEIRLLGYTVGVKGTKINDETVMEIEKITSPRTVRQLRSFIGLITYYSRFYRNFAIRLQPFYDLLKKNNKWQWKDVHEKLFQEIKADFKNTLTLCREF